MKLIELATVRSFVAAINAHDLGAMSSLMTPDHLRVDSLGRVAAGRELAVDAWIHDFATFPGYRIRADLMLQDRAVVAVFGAWTAAPEPAPETGGGRRAEGGPAAWRVVVEHGRVRTWQLYTDHGPSSAAADEVRLVHEHSA